MNSKAFLISGFLGAALDWENFKLDGYGLEAFGADHFLASGGFWEAGEEINRLARVHCAQTLMGYSLGARLALHALTLPSSSWQNAVIISGNPGINSARANSDERMIRWQSDLRWAKKFKNEPWEKVLSEWNAQPVFGGKSLPLHRPENNANRDMHARVLLEFSLAKQEDLRARLSLVKVPVLFVAGEQDQKFSELACEMSGICPKGQRLIVNSVGHRVPWEIGMNEFSSRIKSFLEEQDEHMVTNQKI